MSGADPRPAPPEELGEYRIERLLGRGAMGEVYLAHDRLLDRSVAIKLLPAATLDDASRERFLREARALARLRHPNVVVIYRVGTARGRPYLVYEYCAGQTLRALDAPLAPARVVELGVGLARGLAAAHRAGVLHRDVKPDNVMLGDDGTVKLIDFGLAYVAGAAPAPVVPPAVTTTLDLASTLDHPARAVAEAPSALASASGEPTLHELVGTPRYLAPELWRYEHATPRSDVYALGVVLYELAVGRPLHAAETLDALRAAVLADTSGAARSAALSGLPEPLARTISRCLEPDPAARFASGDGVREALEKQRLPAASAAVSTGCPYRGLLPFEREDAGLFFGRGADVAAVVDRLRSTPLVLVVGSSGIGKSSLLRAGVAPAVEAGALGGAFARVEVIAPGALERVAESLAAGTVLVVDPLDEGLGALSPEALALRLGTLGQLAETGRARVLAAVRAEALPAVVEGLGGALDLGQGLHVLGPPSREALTEAVVAPAAAAGVRFESPEMVGELVEAGLAPGGLPLLQFVLAALWERRQGGVLGREALVGLGGVDGALARHADQVLGALPQRIAAAAEGLLRALVAQDGTRARLDLRAQAADGDAARALDALVRGRLVTARAEGAAIEHELAHDALLAAWPRLREVVAHGIEVRGRLDRLTRAAEAWDRLGRIAEPLWGPRQLAEVPVGAPLGPLAAAFVAASRRVHRRRRVQRALLAGAALFLAGGTWGLAQWRTVSARDAAIDEARGGASAAFDQARRDRALAETSAYQAFSDFDAARWPAGETRWADALARHAAAERMLDEAEARFGRALALDPLRPSSRADQAALLAERVRLAAVIHDGRAIRAARVRLSGLAPDHPSLADATRLLAEIAPAPAPPPQPAAGEPAFVDVPAGSFWTGSAAPEPLRRGFFFAPPLHRTRTAAFRIARHETTHGEWLEFLRALPPEERALRRPRAGKRGFALELDADLALRLELGGRTQRVRPGERLRFPGRDRRVLVDWLRMPVSAVSFDDARAYARWLDATGRVPGARLCTELEWERAARGDADARELPHGADHLEPDDAAFDRTYGQRPDGFGPDEVGSHPRSRSPYGVEDLAGNVWEWVTSAEREGDPVFRGGSFYQADLNCRVTNREHGELDQRDPIVGVRLCAGAVRGSDPSRPGTTR